MALQIHNIEIVPGSSALGQPDRLQILLQKQIANLIGGGAGQAVAVAVTGLQLPANYAVFVSPDQDATYYISARTQVGFTINLLPRLAANTLAVGKLDILVLG